MTKDEASKVITSVLAGVALNKMHGVSTVKAIEKCLRHFFPDVDWYAAIAEERSKQDDRDHTTFALLYNFGEPQ